VIEWWHIVFLAIGSAAYLARKYLDSKKDKN
jgi:hypothetical protein